MVAAQVGMTTAIATVKSVNWGVMQNTSVVMDTLKDAANKCKPSQLFFVCFSELSYLIR